jgi:hypothetical protein
MPRDWEIPDADEYDEDEDEFGPGSPDYDLSEEHGYLWYPKHEHWPVPPWLLAVVAIIVVFALLVPSIIVLLH